MLSHVPIAHLPTPVEPLLRLTRHLQGPELLVKRDDQTGLAFGGNKTRKLAYLLGEAQDQGARTLVTTGSVQSNHCRQTAAAAAKQGLDCILVLAGDPPPKASANLLLDRLLNAELRWTTRPERDSTLQSVFEEARRAGRKPYLVPYGGSSPTGAAAYAFALQEMLIQGVNPDWIVFASSSGGTQAGLVAGAEIHGFRGRILGISVDEPAGELQDCVAELASQICTLLGKPKVFQKGEILVNADYLGRGYGIMGAPEREAILLFAKQEGLLLDPVYTGRAAAGLLDLIRKERLPVDQTVLFWHTGGTPALFADQYGDQLN